MKQAILRVGAPGLRQIASEVTDLNDPLVIRAAADLAAAISDFRAEHGFGRAIAAPQIGIAQRMIGLALPGWPSVIVNPQITWKSTEQLTLWDDCMCFPEMLVRVTRHASISISFVTLGGVVDERTHLGTAESELLQHEIDHLDGILSFDRAVGENPVVHRSVYEQDRELFSRLVDYYPNPV